MAYRTQGDLDLKQINLSYFCRRCKQTVRGIPITNPVYHISEFDDDPWIICRCPTRLCELTFVVYNRLNDQIYTTYPLSGFSAKDYHEAIPEEIREDLAEADTCFNAGAYKGSVVMLRRAIQHIILNQITDPSIKKKKLWEQIDALFDVGLITKNLKESAHEIRHFGNFGAHPDEDNLDKTTREEVRIADRLTYDIIRAIYINPFETEKLKSKRNG